MIISKNSLKITFRNLVRKKIFAAINITGLSVSFAGALLIYLYASHELSYDQYNERADRIYRIYCAYASPGEATHEFPFTPPVLAPAMRDEIAGIEQSVRVYPYESKVIVQHDEKAYNETDVAKVDSGFFRIFTARFLSGNPATVLTAPKSVVLTKSAATKYFSDPTLAPGKSLEIDVYGRETYTVTGVIEDFPSSSHFHFNVLLSVNYGEEKFNPDNWLAHDPATYLLLTGDIRPTRVEEQLRRMTERILGPIYKRRFGKTYAETKAAGGLQEYRLQPLTAVHLHSAQMGEEGNILYIYIFLGIGLLLICIACFNYINLSTARAAWEAKGTSIRKLLGAKRSELYSIFILESLGVAILAALVAVVIVQVVLSLNNPFLQRFTPSDTPLLEGSLLLMAIAVVAGLLSGLLPAQLLSKNKPTLVLKGQHVAGAKGSGIRQLLVVTQFAVSMGLIMCTLLINEQLTFLQSRSLGFDKERLLIIRNVDKLSDAETLKKALLNEHFVVDASLCYDEIGAPRNSAAFTPVELIDNGRQDLVVGIPVYLGDQDYLKTLGATLIMGHPFPPDLRREHQQIILNEEALRAIGWQDRKEADLVGKIIDVNGLRYELAGIVKDYNFESLRQKIEPAAILSHYYSAFDMLIMRIRPGTHLQALQRAQETWKQLAPALPFDYSFLDEDLDRLYGSEQRTAKLFWCFGGLAIFIACLGLLGLAIFSAERRVKEIGVRKVLGASVQSIVILLSKNILKLILIAFVVATPVVWYAGHRWLMNFAYHIEIRESLFLIAGGLTLTIALLTISYQAIKAAVTNPVESLRYE